MTRVIIHYAYRVDPFKAVHRAVYYGKTADEVLKTWYSTPACFDFREITSVYVEEV